MARSVMSGSLQSQLPRIAAGVSVFAVAAAAVWLMGFDLYWSVASVLAVIPLAAVLATAGLEEDAPWDPLWRESPRGIRLTIAAIEQSLEACDRLAKNSPSAVRHARALLHDERDDRQARSAIVRRVRALLIATNAHTILRPDDDHPVTAADIAESLDIIERLSAQKKLKTSL